MQKKHSRNPVQTGVNACVCMWCMPIFDTKECVQCRRPKLKAKVDHIIEKLTGDGSTIFEEEKRDEEDTSPAGFTPPTTNRTESFQAEPSGMCIWLPKHAWRGFT